jgi:hypothetical protein
MKHIYKNNIKKNTTKTLKGLKTVKAKKDRMEFLRIYAMNKNNEYVKRSFGGQHVPSTGSNRRNAKRSHFHHL